MIKNRERHVMPSTALEDLGRAYVDTSKRIYEMGEIKQEKLVSIRPPQVVERKRSRLSKLFSDIRRSLDGK